MYFHWVKVEFSTAAERNLIAVCSACKFLKCWHFIIILVIMTEVDIASVTLFSWELSGAFYYYDNTVFTQSTLCLHLDDLCCEPCPYNWFPRNEKCFFISDDYVTFYEANEKCKSMRSTLAPVYSDEDQYLLVSGLADERYLKVDRSHHDCFAQLFLSLVQNFAHERLRIWK